MVTIHYLSAKQSPTLTSSVEYNFSEQNESSSYAIKQPRDSLLTLNNDCLYKIFQLLELDDCMNIAATCMRLQDSVGWIFEKKFSVIEFTPEMYRRGKNYIDRVFFYTSAYLTSLSVNYLDKSGYLLKKASRCLGLRSLIINRIILDVDKKMSSFGDFHNLELLSLFSCSFRFDEDFFKSFFNLKYLSVTSCQAFHQNTMRKMFENNKEIESFAFVHNSFKRCDLQLLKLLPKLERLCLGGYFKDGNFNELSQLNGLKKLKLKTFQHGTISKLLAKLTYLEELEIYGFQIDEKTMNALKGFDELKLLVIRPIVFHFIPQLLQWSSSFVLPSTIKQLRLECVEISTQQINSIVTQLGSLEDFQLKTCDILDGNKAKISGLEKIAQLITGHTLSRKAQMVNVVIIDSKYSSTVIQLHKLNFCQPFYL